VEALRRDGLDISRSPTQSVFDLFKDGRRFDYVITVCDEAAAERCPVFPGVTNRLGWSFEDPSTFEGSPEEQVVQTIAVRDAIRDRVQGWLAEQATLPRFGRARRARTETG
jgi:arsenate reductase